MIGSYYYGDKYLIIRISNLGSQLTKTMWPTSVTLSPRVDILVCDFKHYDDLANETIVATG